MKKTAKMVCCSIALLISLVLPAGATRHFIWNYALAENYDEYKTNISSQDLPDDVVTYERISVFGEFESLYSYFSNEVFSDQVVHNHYYYHLVDENNVRLRVHIESIYKHSDHRNCVAFLYPDLVKEGQRVNIFLSPEEDLRTHRRPVGPNVDSLAWCNIANTAYIYENGSLDRIVFIFDEMYVSITVAPKKGDACQNLSQYPTDGKNTFLKKLLMLSTAPEAEEELRARIEGTYVSPWVIAGAIGGGVVAVALVATVSSVVTVKVMRKKAKREEEDITDGDGSGGNGSSGGDTTPPDENVTPPDTPTPNTPPDE